MLYQSSIGAAALALALGMAMTEAAAFDDAKYPEIRGAWARPPGVRAQWDSTKRPGTQQDAPLTPEYQAIFKANQAITDSGGQEYNAQVRCLPSGVPRVMVAYNPLEIIVTPDITYIRSDHLTETRRIYTDGRDWPKTITPTFEGYSIGKWVDEDGDGRYGALEVETRGFKGPRGFDGTGLVFHSDNQSIVKERMFLDKADRNLLHDQVTAIDHSLTRPWTVVRDFRRDPHPVWVEFICREDNHYVQIAKETYFLSGDRVLMPTRKNQPAPDLRNFDRNR